MAINRAGSRVQQPCHQPVGFVSSPSLPLKHSTASRSFRLFKRTASGGRESLRCSNTSVVRAATLGGIEKPGRSIHINGDVYPRPDCKPTSGEYDYIIVGGGAAGCVLANRLSAKPSNRVLVLEAGAEHATQDVRVPARITRLFRGKLDWNLYTTAQETLGNRKVYMTRSKILGGSSAANATLYHRGTAEDYDRWGVPGWGSEDVLPWFIKCENNSHYQAGKHHGRGGSMHVENPRYHNEMHDVFFAAAKEVGLQHNDDFNDWSHPQGGYGEFQVTQENGQRADMFRQYLQPVMDRKNLQVLTGAQTLKVDFNGSGSDLTASGVAFVTKGPDGHPHTARVKAGGEVILAAGAVNTPHLLKRSGIGPREELEQHGIPVVKENSAVGENLQDHPAVVCSCLSKSEKDGTSLTDHINAAGSMQTRTRATLSWALFGKGPLATTGCDHGAFISTLGENQPDLQVRFVPTAALDPSGTGSYKLAGHTEHFGHKYPSGFSFQMVAIRPKSRGSIGLSSGDPFDPPRFEGGFLTDPEGRDLETLRNGLKWARGAAASGAFADWLDREIYPGPDVQTDEQIDAYIRRTLHSANALVGTCRMGSDPSESVVNPRLQVHGVKGLRVIDSSVMPTTPGGQTGVPTVMIAERGASFLADSAAGGRVVQQQEGTHNEGRTTERGFLEGRELVLEFPEPAGVLQNDGELC